ncbi:MAG: prepilin-type N-terminal cleavage/methylation domain-containing protein [bacterium]
MKKPHGFTLIELLIVVAIIGILAAIAVPNFMNARIRAKVARAKADLRAAQIAIDTYQVDHGSFPWTDERIHYGLPTDPRWIPLTTPVAYFTAIPMDPFGNKPNDPKPANSRNEHLDYEFWCSWSDPNRSAVSTFPWIRVITTRLSEDLRRKISSPLAGGYFILSQGPDRVCFFDAFRVYNVDVPTQTAALYDATNGLISPGDIVRGGPGGLAFD